MEDLDWLEEERKNKRGEFEEPENIRKKKKKHYLIKGANKISLFNYSFELCAQQLLAVHCL